MRVYLGSDHAGFELKARLIEHVRTLGHEAVDCGAATFDPEDDYPAPCITAGARTTWDRGTWDAHLNWQGHCRPGDCHPTRPMAPPGRYRLVWHRLPDHPAVPSDWFVLT